MRVFEKQKSIRLNACFYCQFCFFLDLEARFVINPPQLLDQKLSFVHHATQSRACGVILAAAPVFGTISVLKRGTKSAAEQETYFETHRNHFTHGNSSSSLNDDCPDTKPLFPSKNDSGSTSYSPRLAS